MNFLSKLFDTSGFPARWVCGSGWATEPGLGWLHVFSDLAIFAAYFAIPCILLFFLQRRKSLPFRSIFLLFGAFILFCGTTHLIEAIIFWSPIYRFAGVVKLLTALISWATVYALIRVVPEVLEMRSPDQLEKEIEARKIVEAQLIRVNMEMETRIDALLASEERFRLLVDGTKDYAIFLLDTQGRVISWNPGAERIKQYHSEEIIGKHYSHFFLPEDVLAGKADQELRIANEEGRCENEGWRVRKDGSIFWASVILTALRDDAGNIRGYSKVTRDITQKKQAEENAIRLVQEETARRAAEELAEVMREQREQLRVTLESIGDGVIATDAEGRIRFLNVVAQNLTGWTDAEAHLKPLEEVFKIVEEKSLRPVENPALRALREGMIVGLANHTLLIHKEGSTYPIDDSGAPIRDLTGNVSGAVLVFRDITERKKAEATQAERNRLIALRADIGSALATPQSTSDTLRQCCEAVVRLYDISHASIWTVNETEASLELAASANLEGEWYGPHDSIPLGERKIGKIASTAQSMLLKNLAEDPEILNDIDYKDMIAQENFMAFGGYPLMVDGRVLGVMSFLAKNAVSEENLDDLMVTGEGIAQYLHRKETEAQLSENEDRLNFALTAADLGQWELNLSTMLAKRTLRHDQIFGYDQLLPEWNHSMFLEHLLTEDRAATEEKVRQVIATKGTLDHEFRIRRKDGEVRWIWTRGRIQSDRNGHVYRMIGMVGDITERKLQEDRLRQLAADLSENDRRKNEFLATLAHELRNPLAPIRNGLQVLKMAGNDPHTAENTRAMMDRQLNHMVRLVDDLLDLSRITRGKLELRKESVDIASVVHNALEATRSFIDQHQHQLTVTLPPAPIILEADPTRLAQVFLNLLNNAAKYSENGGHIWLRAEQQGNHVIVAIKDTGIGISAEHLPHLFEMFSQVETALNRSQGGLGIGLALVRGLVEMHGGTIQAQSEGAGKGTEFIVTLPMAPFANPPMVANDTTKAPSSPKLKRRILVVDDNRDSAGSLSMLMSMLGNETKTAYDGLEAISIAEQFKPNVILLDVGLPKLNGYEVCNRIRALPGGDKILIIALTGWGQEDDRRRSKEAGFDHHLIKPVEMNTLQKLIETT